ncbi:DUF1631 family protein [Rhodoferax bucti]|uniref:DUF1631 family protein n=1 Tax=Rhodoferax bucti TaxID=2576305 RepID=UPI001108D5A2|nr:DUF1631 family protein [Rhodoferax bucti]
MPDSGDKNGPKMKKYLLRRLGVAHEPGDTKPSLSTCIEAVLEQSDALLDDVFAGLQAMLGVAGGNTLHARQHPVRRATVEKLLAQGHEAKAVFRVELRSAIYGGGSFRKPQISQVRFDDFQFLEEDQIDANIEWAVTEQEVNRSVEGVLPALNALVSSLMGWASVQAHLNPLKPEAFVHALRESLGQVIPDDEARAAVMAPAAGLMGTALSQMYRELVEWLKSHGVEPVATAAASSNPFGGPVKAPDTPVTRSLLTLDKLRRLLSGELDSPVSPSGSVDFSHTVPASFVALEDMKLVEPMLKRLALRASQPVIDAEDGTSPRAVAARGKGDVLQGRALGKELGQEVVRLMLENLMQDRRLLPGVRQSILRMEPVLQRLSVLDPRFFADRKHPARIFLDRMTHRSLAFQSENDAGFARFHKTLVNAISVLAGGEGDAKAFERMVRKLEEGWSQDELQQRQLAAEAARGLMHAEQRQMLAQRLAQEFVQRMTFKNAPEFVLAFLRGPWAQVVAESQLRCTDGREDADGYLALVDDLIWSVQPRLVRKSRARLVALVPQMLVQIRQGLARIDFPEERIPLFFDALIAVHEQAFDNAKFVAQRDAPASPAAPPAELSAEELWLAEEEAQDSGFVFDTAVPITPPDAPEVADPELQSAWSAESLHTGAWVDMALGGVWVRAQLTWSSPHRTLFMFTSGGGLAHSMSRRTMDRLRGLGLIHLVSDGHVVDNALDAVARQALRNDVKNASEDGSVD